MLNVYINERNLFRSIDEKNEKYGNLLQAMEDVESLRECLGYAEISESDLKISALSLLEISDSIKELEAVSELIGESILDLEEA